MPTIGLDIKIIDDDDGTKLMIIRHFMNKNEHIKTGFYTGKSMYNLTRLQSKITISGSIYWKNEEMKIVL